MTDGWNSTRNRTFDALIKEAEFIRSEALSCIENVRKLAVNSTYIAGFALPIVASMLSIKEGSTGIYSVETLVDALNKNLLLIQFVCLGVSLVCLAFLRIYVGNFLQILLSRLFQRTFDASNNSTVNNTDIKLFHWENWLKDHRSKKSLFIGDADLAAEPILIGLYVLTYGAAFVAMGYFANSFPISSMITGGIILITVILTYMKFIMVLRDAAAD